MNSDGDNILTNLEAIEFLNGSISALLLQELNVPKTSALTILENFEFARSNFSEFIEKFHEFLLVNILWQVPDNDVSLAVKILFLLLVEDDLLSVDGLVVHFLHASFGFILLNEVQIAESKRLVRVFVEHDLGTLNTVSFAGKEFVKV